MGISSNQMPIINRIITDVIYGIIWFKLDDCNEEFDFEELSTYEQLQIIQQLV